MVIAFFENNRFEEKQPNNGINYWPAGALEQANR